MAECSFLNPFCPRRADILSVMVRIRIPIVYVLLVSADKGIIAQSFRKRFALYCPLASFFAAFGHIRYDQLQQFIYKFFIPLLQKFRTKIKFFNYF